MTVGKSDIGLAWGRELTRLGVDKEAMKSLFMVSQASPNHYTKACDLIHQLMIKEHEGSGAYRTGISAYVWSSVRQIWRST